MEYKEITGYNGVISCGKIMMWANGIVGFDDAKKIQLFDPTQQPIQKPEHHWSDIFSLFYILYLILKKLFIRRLKK